MTATMPVPVWSFGFARGYVRTMRPHLLWVSGITGLTGLSLVSGVSASDAIVLGLVFFASYGFGQALTDCFQLDTDTLAAPDRPLVQGTLRRRDVLTVSATALAACGAVVARYHPANLVLAPLAVLGLAVYTWFKRRWWGGPPWNAAIVVVLLLVGYASGVGAAGARMTWDASLVGAVVTSFFGYANFVLAGYLKDLSADRATAYRTFPVVFGWGPTRVASHAIASIAALAAIVTVAGPVPPTVLAPSFAFVAAGVLATVVGQWRLAGVHSELVAHRAIVPTVHAYVLLLSGIAARHEPQWAPVLAASYVFFTVLMRRRPSLGQV